MIKYSSPNDNNNRIIKESNYKTNLYICTFYKNREEKFK